VSDRPASLWDSALVDAYQFVVTEPDSGLRLDQYLSARELPQTRSQLKRHIGDGCCVVNDRPARPAKRLRSGDVVTYRPPPLRSLEVEPEAIPLCILHEDDQLIVIDKPPGMVVHPAPGNPEGTLVSALLAHCHDLSGIGGVSRPGIVHRLDKLTSGVMVAAKTDAAHRALAVQFSEHTIERRYLALVCGYPDPPSGCIRTLHARHPRDRKRFTSRCERGRTAVTHYRVLEHLEAVSLLEARLETGRTHQVRVHFADQGHPLLGDPVYGRLPVDREARQVAKQLGRQALHAHLLAFDHPRSLERLRFVSPLPADIQTALTALRR
jgi:23S rRNA pseudouridine1911/1915/1917 synthase